MCPEALDAYCTFSSASSRADQKQWLSPWVILGHTCGWGSGDVPLKRKANEGKSRSVKVDTSRGLGLASGMGKSPPSQSERKMVSGVGVWKGGGLHK